MTSASMFFGGTSELQLNVPRHCSLFGLLIAQSQVPSKPCQLFQVPLFEMAGETQRNGNPSKNAYVTLLTRPSYLAGAILLAYTLNKHSPSTPLIICYTPETLPESSVHAFAAEAKHSNIVLKPVEHLRLPDDGTAHGMVAERFIDTWTKLRVFDLWDMEQKWEKLCWLDADMMIFSDPSPLVFNQQNDGYLTGGDGMRTMAVRLWEERRYATCVLYSQLLLTPNRNCKWLPFLLPPQDQEDYVLRESGMTSSSESTSPNTATSLRRLIDETSDLIDSPAFSRVLTQLLDAAFSHLVDDKISQLSYKIPPISESHARVQEIVGSDVKTKVANSLAVFCRQAHSIGSGANNEYLAAVEAVRGLEAFAAVVYSSNFEYESPETAALIQPAPAQEQLSKSTPAQSDTVNQSSEKADDPFENAWGKALAKEDGQQY